MFIIRTKANDSKGLEITVTLYDLQWPLSSNLS